MLNKYWLTFTISTEVVDGETDSYRRNALYDAIDKLSTRWWVEPTSFMLFESRLEIGNVALKCREVISMDDDIVLIHKLNATDSAVVGNVEYLQELKQFVPYLKRV